LPPISQQLLVIDDRSSNEVYTLIYRTLSWDIHGGPLAGDAYTEHDVGGAYYDDWGLTGLYARALAAKTFTATLKTICRELGEQGIERAADEIHD